MDRIESKAIYRILTERIRREVITFCIWGLPILEILKEDQKISTYNLAR